MPISRASAITEPGVLVPVPDGGTWQSIYPTLWEYLTSTQWAEGGVRKTATLLVFTEEGEVKLCLNDRAANRTRWCQAETLNSVLAMLESELATDQGGWRKYKPFKKS